MTNLIHNSSDDNSSSDRTVTVTDEDGTSHQVTFDVDIADPASIDEDEVNLFIAIFIVGTIIYAIIMVFAMAFKYFLLKPFEYGCRSH